MSVSFGEHFSLLHIQDQREKSRWYHNIVAYLLAKYSDFIRDSSIYPQGYQGHDQTDDDDDQDTDDDDDDDGLSLVCYSDLDKRDNHPHTRHEVNSVVD